ncbi:MAG TPA: DUF721 domain-containing protein [Gammaproteobacteria bacterium]
MPTAKMPTTFNSVNSILENDKSALADLLQHIRRLQALDRELSTCLGQPLSGHCCIANITDDMLVLHADTSAWAAKIRYLTPNILEHIRRECQLPSLKSVRIRVLPKQSEPQKQKSPVPGITARTSSFLEQAAVSTSDPELRTRFLKLAKLNKS